MQRRAPAPTTNWATDPWIDAALRGTPLPEGHAPASAGAPAAATPVQRKRAGAPTAAPASTTHGPDDARPLVAAEEGDAEILSLQPGETVRVEASAAEDIELVVSRTDGVVAQRQGRFVRSAYTAAASEQIRVEARAPGGGLSGGRAPSARLMIAVEPATRRASGDEGDGADYLNARQHLLLNLFGVAPRSLHAQTGLALAEALDALELVARSAAEGAPAAMPAGVGRHALTIEQSASGATERARYRLASDDATLLLETVFDGRTGELTTRLGYRDTEGTEIRGALRHTVAREDDIPLQPARDPIGEYLAGEPGRVGALDDFSDLAAGSEGRRSREGVGSFLEGALAGDLADNDSWSAIGGQVAIGLVPVAGQIADLRDIAGAGADVVRGEDGGWARLGISVVAVIPGLDFLKGGSRAGRKALQEAAEEAGQGTAQAGLKQAAKVLSKEAAGRAARELRNLAVARRELLARWQLLMADSSLSPGARAALRKGRNALQDHLQPSDLSGALRDKVGVPVRASGSGAAWDHLNEVNETMNALRRLDDKLKWELQRLPASTQPFKDVSATIDAVREMRDRIAAFLEIR